VEGSLEMRQGAVSAIQVRSTPRFRVGSLEYDHSVRLDERVRLQDGSRRLSATRRTSWSHRRRWGY